jgi:jumonji domain-containing protein 2
LAGKAGAFKVIPPKRWKARKEGYDKLEMSVQRPIEQNVWGSNGIYELMYLLRESRSLKSYSNSVLPNKDSYFEIEKLFWKTLKLNAPLYGADIEGSLMDSGASWNLAEIETTLKEGLEDVRLSGVTIPYLYVGDWKTMFGWHKEDLDLYSINYLHHGAAKIWYIIDIDSSADFEKFVSKCYSEKFDKCSEYLRHKNTLMHPALLMKNGIKIRKIYQEPGEFVVPRATGYHAGFNTGYNIAEAVNFAVFNWVENIASKVKFCNCIKDSVKINMSTFCQTLIEKYKNDRSKDRKHKVKVMKRVLLDDQKNKVLFQGKLDALKEKKDKALEHRRSTIDRKRKRLDAISKKPAKIAQHKRVRTR